MTIITRDINFVIVHCVDCGIAFAFSTDFQKRRINDHQDFYCPNGHRQIYTGQTEAQKLRDELERTRQMKEAAEARANTEHAKTVAISKAHMKMRKRVMNGVCPCCNRTFQNLMRHMHTQHAGEINLRTIREAYGMTQAAMADEIGVTGNYVSMYERNKAVPVQAKQTIETWIASQEPQS